MKKVIKDRKHPVFLNDIKVKDFDAYSYGDNRWWFCSKHNLIFEQEDDVVLFKQGNESYLQCTKCDTRLTYGTPEYFEDKYIIEDVEK